MHSNNLYHMGSAKPKPGICGQRRLRSVCASAQSDQGLQCKLKESLDIAECMNGEKRRYFGHAQDDVNSHILRMPEGTFALDAAHIRRDRVNNLAVFKEENLVEIQCGDNISAL